MFKMDQNQEKPTNIRQQEAQLIQSKSDSDQTNKIVQNQLQQAQEKKTYKSHKWNNQHLVRYLILLTLHYKKYENAIPHEKMKWYSFLGEVLQVKGQENIGIHHRKYLQRFKDIQGIINHLKMIVCYHNVDIAQEIKKVKEKFYSMQQKKFKFFEELFEQQFDNQHVEILNTSSIIYSVKPSVEYNKITQTNLFIQEQNSTEKSQQIMIPVEFLIVVKRRDLFKDVDQTIEMKKIDEIIKKFESNQTIRKRRNFIKRAKKKKTTSHIDKKIKVISGIFGEKQEKLQKQEIYESQQIKKQIENQYHPRHLKKKVQWTKNQTIKLIVFLHIMKQKLQIENLNKIFHMHLKCSQYINTDKTYNDAKIKIFGMKNWYQDQFWSTGIQKQAIKHQIPSSLIEMEKQKYFLLQNNPLKCSLHLQCKKLELEIPSKLSKENLKQHIENQIKEKFCMVVGLNINHSNKDVFSKKQNHKINDQHFNEQYRGIKIKQILHLQLSNKLFSIYRKSFTDSIYQSKNFNIRQIRLSNPVQFIKID